MERAEVEHLVRDILVRLGSGGAPAVFREYAHPHDMSIEFFEEMVQRMGVSLIPPPAGADLKMIAARNNAASREVWNVDVPIWTREHGQSSWLRLWIEPGVVTPIVIIQALFE